MYLRSCFFFFLLFLFLSLLSWKSQGQKSMEDQVWQLLKAKTNHWTCLCWTRAILRDTKRCWGISNTTTGACGKNCLQNTLQGFWRCGLERSIGTISAWYNLERWLRSAQLEGSSPRCASTKIESQKHILLLFLTPRSASQGLPELLQAVMQQTPTCSPMPCSGQLEQFASKTWQQ